jgi:hypothetical protein
MGRDHSIRCAFCGASYGGFDGPDRCPCRDIVSAGGLPTTLVAAPVICETCERWRPIVEAAKAWYAIEQEIAEIPWPDRDVPPTLRQSEWRALDALRAAISHALAEDKT